MRKKKSDKNRKNLPVSENTRNYPSKRNVRRFRGSWKISRQIDRSKRAEFVIKDMKKSQRPTYEDFALQVKRKY